MLSLLVYFVFCRKSKGCKQSSNTSIQCHLAFLGETGMFLTLWIRDIKFALLSLIFALHCQISSKFLKPTKKTIDLVGNEKMKASTNVRHIVLPCSTSAIPQVIPDIIRCYGRLGFPPFCLLLFFFWGSISMAATSRYMA